MCNHKELLIAKHGEDALMKAADEGHAHCIELLLANGVSACAKDESGYTALMQASEAGHAHVVELLIEKGAEVNAMASGISAIKEAKKNGHDAVMELLRYNGAVEDD